MKTNLKLHAAIVAATLVFGGVATVSHAATNDSPAGLTWDCVMSGARNGLATMVFTGDGSPGSTFIGFEILVPRLKSQNTSGRGGEGSDSRTGDSGSSGSTNSNAGIFGGIDFSGSWTFNSKGQVVGFYPEFGTTGGTNATVITNSVGFTGTVSLATDPLKSRMTLLCSTPAGKVTVQCRMAVPPPVVAFDGQWIGTKNQKNQAFTEIFLMTQEPTSIIYDVDGGGAGYTYSGNAIISRQNKIAFSLFMDQNENVRATFGSFNQTKATSKTKGWDQPAGPLANPAHFKVEKP